LVKKGPAVDLGSLTRLDRPYDFHLGDEMAVSHMRQPYAALNRTYTND